MLVGHSPWDSFGYLCVGAKEKRIFIGLLTFWSVPCYIEAYEKDVVWCSNSNDVGAAS